jgi:hypothetical protein
MLSFTVSCTSFCVSLVTSSLVSFMSWILSLCFPGSDPEVPVTSALKTLVLVPFPLPTSTCFYEGVPFPPPPPYFSCCSLLWPRLSNPNSSRLSNLSSPFRKNYIIQVLLFRISFSYYYTINFNTNKLKMLNYYHYILIIKFLLFKLLFSYYYKINLNTNNINFNTNNINLNTNNINFKI